ncbi:hypothetical protein FTO74_17770 [Granulicella sp. WH15]|uniref:hypothetical protein n=1 Tax=Granulicella sp. WH15 TaxID=2602070 RepID=UPI001366E159|nr:hypothetical protein [Granulicella sp. WH15]QHN04999.1 hypothetical protein FTO74_17770 [Granulicella sp. WH15]
MITAMKEEEPRTGSLDRDPRWQLTQRIVATPHFARSPRLSSFLLYVCRQSILGRSTGLNEQSIGETVFGRPVGYDPRDDNIVRAHAGRLRLRIETYFREEGASEILHLSIPRGSYIPVFERIERKESGASEPIPEADSHDAEYAEEILPEITPRVKAIPARPRFLLPGVLAIAGVLLASLSAYGFFTHWSWGRKTPTDKLWAQLFRPDQNTIIVPADVSLVLAQLITGHSVDLAEYASGRYKSVASCDAPCDRRLAQEVESRRYTSMADLEFAAALARLPQALPDRTQIRYVRDLQLEDFKQSNLIMAGSLIADPWLSVVQREMNFILHDNLSTGPLRVENVKPKPNEKKEYLFRDDDPRHRGLATIAFLPNLSGNGNMVIVQGFTLAGTEAAAEFVTSGKDFDSLFHAFAGNNSRLPHFEILLETMDVNGMASRPNVLASHTYP